MAAPRPPPAPFRRAADAKLASGRSYFIGAMLLVTVFPFLFVPIAAKFGESYSSLRDMRTVLFLLSSMHVALTPFFYSDPSMRGYFSKHKFRYYYATIGCIAGTALIFILCGKQYINYFYIVYHVLLLWHHTRQDYGLLAFVAIATGAGRPSGLERYCLYFASFAGMLGLVRFFTEGTVFAGYEAKFVQAGLLVYLVSVVMAITAMVRAEAILDARWRWTTFLILFGFFVPTFLYEDKMSAFSSYALAHALQYFVFMYYVGSDSKGAGEGKNRFLKLVFTFSLTSAFLMLLRDGDIWGNASWPLLGAFWGVVFSHFVVDAGVWRLSKPFQREYMRSAFSTLFKR